VESLLQSFRQRCCSWRVENGLMPQRNFCLSNNNESIFWNSRYNRDDFEVIRKKGGRIRLRIKRGAMTSKGLLQLVAEAPGCKHEAAARHFPSLRDIVSFQSRY
jgi:hypothetical protein